MTLGKTGLTLFIVMLMACSSDDKNGGETPDAGASTMADAGDTNDETSALTEEDSETTDVANDESELLGATVDGAEKAKRGALREGTPPTAEEVAMHAATKFLDKMENAECVTTAIDGDTVTFTLTECTGKRGLRKLSGTLVVEYSVAEDGTITAHSTGTALTMSNSAGKMATLDVSATATYKATDTGKTLSVTSSGMFKGPVGGAMDRSATYTVSWDADCRTIDGTWTFTKTLPGPMMKVQTRSTKITGLKRCMTGCPTGKVELTRPNGLVITVTYDGTNMATTMTSKGGSGTKVLECTPAT